MWGQEKSQRGRTLDGSLASITPAPQPSMAPTAGSKPWSLARHALSSMAHALLLAVVNEYRLLWLWGERTQLSGWS